MRTELYYTVSIDNENNEDWVDVYNGPDLTEAEKTFKEYKFVEGDQRLQLTEYKKYWRYEGQERPQYDPTPNTLKERFNF